jgi:hypothetical protein
MKFAFPSRLHRPGFDFGKASAGGERMACVGLGWGLRQPPSEKGRLRMLNETHAEELKRSGYSFRAASRTPERLNVFQT